MMVVLFSDGLTGKHSKHQCLADENMDILWCKFESLGNSVNMTNSKSCVIDFEISM